jgi:hypothetical protein
MARTHSRTTEQKAEPTTGTPASTSAPASVPAQTAATASASAKSAAPAASPAAAPVSRICVEIEQLRDEAHRQLNAANRRARLWALVDVVVGFPAAVLAAVAGAVGLVSTHERVPAAILAFAAAAFVAGASVLRADRRRAANKRLRRAWADAEAEARVVLAQSAQLKQDALVQGLRAVFAKRDTAMGTHEGDH